MALLQIGQWNSVNIYQFWILFKDKTYFPIFLWGLFASEISNCAEMQLEVSKYLSLLSSLYLQKALLYRIKQQYPSKA